MKIFRLAFLAAAASTILAAPALADSFTYTLSTSSVTLAPGATYEVSGTISAASSNSATYFLGDSDTTSGPITLDDTDFLQNTPLTLDPGQSYTGALFTVTAAADAAPGAYKQYFDALFYTDPSGGDAIDQSQPFTVNVANATSAVTPEPGSWLLLSTGLAGVGMLRRRFATNRA